MAAEVGQALETKRVSSRITLADAVVIVGALVAVLLGWFVKQYDDTRMVDADVEGISISYPRGWLSLPAQEPALFQAVSDQEVGTRLTLYAQPSAATDIRQAPIFAGSINPAEGETAYSRLASGPATVAGNDAIRSDYAYVQTTVGRATAPVVIYGRQYNWIANGTLYVLALEAPEDQWNTARDHFARILDTVASA